MSAARWQQRRVRAAGWMEPGVCVDRYAGTRGKHTPRTVFFFTNAPVPVCSVYARSEGEGERKKEKDALSRRGVGESRMVRKEKKSGSWKTEERKKGGKREGKREAARHPSRGGEDRRFIYTEKSSCRMDKEKTKHYDSMGDGMGLMRCEWKASRGGTSHVGHQMHQKVLASVRHSLRCFPRRCWSIHPLLLCLVAPTTFLVEPEGEGGRWSVPPSASHSPLQAHAGAHCRALRAP